MSEETKGPHVTVNVSCIRCVNSLSIRRNIKGEIGHAVYCTHGADRKWISNAHHDTPNWCPLYPSFVAEFQAMLLEREKGKPND